MLGCYFVLTFLTFPSFLWSVGNLPVRLRKRKLNPAIVQSQMARNNDNVPGQCWAVVFAELIPWSSMNLCSS